MAYKILLVVSIVYNLWILWKTYRQVVYPKLKIKIHKAMWKIAEENSIPIYIKTKEEMYKDGDLCAGLFTAPLINGRYTELGYKYIRILEKYKDDPYVLAHELGHYKSIKHYNDYTEEGANKQAQQMISNSLSFVEWLVVKPFVDRWF
jgi:hypothetical protein